MYLFFDTETTGVPRNYNAPLTDSENWPRLVQIGWVLYDDEKNLVAEAEFVVKPNGFEIPEGASSVHGITTEKALSVGDPLEEVADIFRNALEKSDVIVGHNLSYDESIMGAEFIRLKMENPIPLKKRVDTMKSSTYYCKLPGSMGKYKWPKLHELYRKLFNEDMGAAHTALQDIQNTAKCYFELKRLGVIA
jgi:DNA polymerase III epsilon subunit-like protein